jgi:hypothetical protein
VSAECCRGQIVFRKLITCSEIGFGRWPIVLKRGSFVESGYVWLKLLQRQIVWEKLLPAIYSLCRDWGVCAWWGPVNDKLSYCSQHTFPYRTFELGCEWQIVFRVTKHTGARGSWRKEKTNGHLGEERNWNQQLVKVERSISRFLWQMVNCHEVGVSEWSRVCKVSVLTDFFALSGQAECTSVVSRKKKKNYRSFSINLQIRVFQWQIVLGKNWMITTLSFVPNSKKG